MCICVCVCVCVLCVCVCVCVRVRVCACMQGVLAGGTNMVITTVAEITSDDQQLLFIVYVADLCYDYHTSHTSHTLVTCYI